MDSPIRAVKRNTSGGNYMNTRRTLLAAVLALFTLTGCATYRYLPGGQEADKVCAAQAREATRNVGRDVARSLVGVLAELGNDPPATQFERWMAVYQPCMTEHGFPPGAPVREKVK
jgi:hypothetical protein